MSIHRVYAERFQSLASKYRRRAERIRAGESIAPDEAGYADDWALHDQAGRLIVAAFERGLLDLDGLADVVAWYRGTIPQLDGHPPDLARIGYNVQGIVVSGAATGARSFKGKAVPHHPPLIAQQYPELFPDVHHYQAAIEQRLEQPDDGDAAFKLLTALNALAEEQSGEALEVLATIIEQGADRGQPKVDPPQPADETEDAIVETLREEGRRLTTEPLLHRALGTVNANGKSRLAGMVKRGIIDNRSDLKPRGYGLPEWS